MITQRTAFSSMFLSASSPYMNSAMYLIGPTSASSFLYSFSYTNFCSRSSSTSFCSASILASSSSVLVSMSSTLTLALALNLLILSCCALTSCAYSLSISLNFCSCLAFNDLISLCALDATDSSSSVAFLTVASYSSEPPNDSSNFCCAALTSVSFLFLACAILDCCCSTDCVMSALTLSLAFSILSNILSSAICSLSST